MEQVKKKEKVKKKKCKRCAELEQKIKQLEEQIYWFKRDVERLEKMCPREARPWWDRIT
jgi:hypothetical protein